MRSPHGRSQAHTGTAARRRRSITAYSCIRLQVPLACKQPTRYNMYWARLQKAYQYYPPSRPYPRSRRRSPGLALSRCCRRYTLYSLLARHVIPGERQTPFDSFVLPAMISSQAHTTRMRRSGPAFSSIAVSSPRPPSCIVRGSGLAAFSCPESSKPRQPSFCTWSTILMYAGRPRDLCALLVWLLTVKLRSGLPIERLDLLAGNCKVRTVSFRIL